MLPLPVTVAVAVAMMGMLNSLRRFFIPSLSPAMFNVATICCDRRAGAGHAGDGLAADPGNRPRNAARGLGQMAIQLAVSCARKDSATSRFWISRTRSLRQILADDEFGTIGVAAVNINVLVNTYLAAAEPGAVSWLGYAFRLMYTPDRLFGVSIATWHCRRLRHAAVDDIAAIRQSVSSALP